MQEHVPLSSLTTLRAGGPARYVVPCGSVADVSAGIAFAKENGLPVRALGQGSNVLASDTGYEGVVLHMRIPGIDVADEGSTVLVTAGAGVSWDGLVADSCARALWGLENLAGIPGTVGAAPVQNIGAYGAEVKDTIVAVRALSLLTGDMRVFSNEECAFGYRDSMFKKSPEWIILSVSFRLRKEGVPALSYKDLAARLEAGDDLSTPTLIASMVRAIRARKFPDLAMFGTAGSFFKNPTVPSDRYARLAERYPGMPGFPNEQGVKIPLAFVLDTVLKLRGFRDGNVSLFAEQPLVLVAHDGATTAEIDAFATMIEARVHAETGIIIEREVRAFL